jgi:ABC-type Fe3+-hydroxamate transport system substrate-binding protein
MKKIFKDQLFREIEVEFPPKRIISLVPSQTELLFDLGLDDAVVGITKFCVHPELNVRSKAKIGGTKKLNVDLIRTLKPDLIIGNKEENTQADIELLMEEFPVWMSDVNTLEDAQSMITSFGLLLDKQPEASYLNYLITAGFTDLQKLAETHGFNKRAAYMIWKDPYMFAGTNTFINDLLKITGFRNVVTIDRYPSLSLSDVASLEPELILLSSEPFPFKEKHVSEIQKAVPNAKVMLVDGEMFSWYGSRLIKSIEYLFHLQNSLL